MRNEILRLLRRFLLLFLAGFYILASLVDYPVPVKGQNVNSEQDPVTRDRVSGKSSGRQSSPSLIIVPNGMAAVTSTYTDIYTLRVLDISQFGALWINPVNRAPNYLATTTEMPLLQGWPSSQFNDSLGDQTMRGLAISADGTRLYAGTSGWGGPNKTPNIYRIGPTSTVPTLLATLPSYVSDPGLRRGIAGLDLDEIHNAVFASSFADGIIYRVDATTGAILGSFDPLTPYVTGTTSLPPHGERVVAVAYNRTENRLYYGIWGYNYFTSTGINSVRSIGLTASGAFLPPTDDKLEFTINSLGSVGDMEFNNAGTRMLLGEDLIEEFSGAVIPDAHKATAVEYIGGTGIWVLDPTLYSGSGSKYAIGAFLSQTNGRGGVAWAYSGITGSGVISGNESFVMFTGDALRLDTVSVYGLQFTPSSGGSSGTVPPSNSIIADLDYDVVTVDKWVYGDVDIRRSLFTTVADVSITGRVLTGNGSGIPKASVILTNVRGDSRTALTNPFGYYKFDGVGAGETYTMMAAAKGRHFMTRILTVDDDLADVNFIASE